MASRFQSILSRLNNWIVMVIMAAAFLTLAALAFAESKASPIKPPFGRENLAVGEFGAPQLQTRNHGGHGLWVEHQRANVTTVPVQSESEYLSPVSVGGQMLQLLLDTGSDDLWVHSNLSSPPGRNGNVYDPLLSTTSRHLEGESFNISYVDGSACYGSMYQDQVGIGELVAPLQPVGYAQVANNDFTLDPADGILGLGFASRWDATSPLKRAFFDRVRPHLESPLFTVHFNHQVPGFITFGYVPSVVPTASLAYFPTVNDSSGYVWQTAVTGWSFAGGNMESIVANGVVDTGSTCLFLPNKMATAYFDKVPGAYYSEVRAKWYYPCGQTLPDVTIQVHNYTAEIPGILLEGKGGGVACMALLQGRHKDDLDTDRISLGAPFLKTTFTVYEHALNEQPRLGFARKHYDG